MECKIPIKDFEVGTGRQGNRKAIMKKEDLPSELQIGQAWKVWGKWMVAIGESDQNEVKIAKVGIQSGHICIVLRGIGFTLYFYELIDDYTKEQYRAFKHIRLLLDRVLVTNQAASARLRYFLETYEDWRGDIFPKFFNTFDNKKIANWSDDIDNMIDMWSNKQFKFENLNRNKYWQEITSSSKNLMDVRGCYEMLLSALNTLKPTLPKENIQIIDELIVRCEHGYFLGYLLKMTLDEYEKKSNSKAGIRTTSFLMKRVEKFRRGREKKVKLASREAFGLTPEVNKKLKRMFEF